MKSTILKGRALHLAVMFMVLIAGLSFVSCASDDGEDQEASPIIGTWMQQASSLGPRFEVYTEEGTYFITTDINNSNSNVESGSYRYANRTLTCTPRKGTARTYTCTFNGRDDLTMTPADPKAGKKQFKRYTNTRVRH